MVYDSHVSTLLYEAFTSTRNRWFLTPAPEVVPPAFQCQKGRPKTQRFKEEDKVIKVPELGRGYYYVAEVGPGFCATPVEVPPRNRRAPEG